MVITFLLVIFLPTLTDMKLTTEQVENKLNTFDYSQLPKPGKNKGDRGQLFEIALGIPNGSDLTDLIDGELKSFTDGQSIKVTLLKHCLKQIVDSVEFFDSIVYKKLKQTIYVGFDREGKFLKSKIGRAHVRTPVTS